MEVTYRKNPESWIAQIFSAKAVGRGGVIRRSVVTVEREIGRDRFLKEIDRRGFHVIECGGQFVVICNSGRIRLLRLLQIFRRKIVLLRPCLLFSPLFYIGLATRAGWNGFAHKTSQDHNGQDIGQSVQKLTRDFDLGKRLNHVWPEGKRLEETE